MTREREIFSPAQCRAGRGLLGWTPERLAELARLELEAIQLFEAGASELSGGELYRIGRAFNMHGVIALPGELAGPGVRFRKPSSAPSARWTPPLLD